jgi:predicted O-methyltransferase YrrM
VSETTTFLTSEHVRYLAARTRAEDSFLIQLKDAARAAGIPAIWISPEQASFMQILLKLRGARDVVEVGTLAGYSAIAMARALPWDGRVRTIELNDEHADFAEEWIARSDVAARVEVLRGAGADVLPRLEAQSADAVFLDADKPGYVTYLEHGMRILRPRGLVMADNAFAFGRLLDPSSADDDVAAVRAFNEHVAGRSDLHSIIAPFGDGCWVCAKE